VTDCGQDVCDAATEAVPVAARSPAEAVAMRAAPERWPEDDVTRKQTSPQPAPGLPDVTGSLPTETASMQRRPVTG